MISSVRPTVVIIGGGFGGINVAKRLSRANVNVVLLDRSNHHLFQPLLYQVATAVLTPADIAFPIRRIFRRQKNVTVYRAEIVRIDLARSVVVQEDGTETRFDWLVIAAGAGQSYFGHPEWEAVAPGMKTIEDASRIRGRVLQAFEDAEAESDPEAQQAHLRFVVVGGGPTGVELSGAIKELAVDAMDPDFRHFDAETAHVILIEAGPRLLNAMSEASSQAARDALERMGVEVRLNTRVTGVDEGGVLIGSERIRTDTVLWAAGVEASPLAKSLGVPLDHSGRIIVKHDCSLPGYPRVFAIGDVSAATCATTKTLVPGVCPAAVQMGNYVGDLIAKESKFGLSDTRSDSAARVGFSYWDKGTLATIGRAKAVADLGKRHFKGFFAWLLWGFVHIFFLIGFRNRVFVALGWAVSYMLFTKGSRIILGDPRSRVLHRIAGPISPRAEP